MKKLFLLIVMIFTFAMITSCNIVDDNPSSSDIKDIYHKVKINLDAKKPSVSIADDATWFEVSVKNSSDLQYVVTTIKITDDEYKNCHYRLYVNGEEIPSKKFTVQDNVITYKVDDPNWSDFI